MIDADILDTNDAELQVGLYLASRLDSIFGDIEVTSIEKKDAVPCPHTSGLMTPDGLPFFTVSTERGVLGVPTHGKAVREAVDRLLAQIPDACRRTWRMHADSASTIDPNKPKLTVMGSPKSWVELRANLLEMQVWVDVALPGSQRIEVGGQ